MTSVGVRGADAAVVACQKKVPVCACYSVRLSLMYLQVIQVLEPGEKREFKLISFGIGPFSCTNTLIHPDNEAAT